VFIINDIYTIFNELLTEIDNKDIIIVNNIKFKEILSRKYIINLDNYIDIDIFLNKEIKYDLENDLIERDRLFEMINNNFILFENDLYTRQFVFQPKYIDNKNLASCLSLFQFIVRDNKLYMYIFVRSQNLLNNFIFDNQTYILLYFNCLERLQKYNIKKAYIDVSITSLHKNVI